MSTVGLVTGVMSMKRTKYPIHPDFKKWENMNPPLNRTIVLVIQRIMGLLFMWEKSTAELTVERKIISVGNGDTIRALWYCPKNVGEEAPCLVYYHGGGFVFPASPHHYSLAKEYAQRACCKVLFVDYRLAPKYPFPIAPEDCYAAYSWVHAHAGELSIDPNRIAVAGDSAGGQLATVVCLMAKERGQVMPCSQMLIYPAVGNVETESAKRYTDTPMCNSRDMEKYGKFYRPDPFVGKNIYASPIEAESLEGLPAAYIETAEFDCLRDGGILYGERLQQFGVSSELYNTKGTMHGFDIVLDSQIVRGCVNRRITFLRREFAARHMV